jgi:cbb3-type cytochrome oxidase maturation protein
MSMLFILVPLSLVLVAFAVWAFIWAVNAGQFDDLDSPAWDMLSDAHELGDAASDKANLIVPVVELATHE